MTKRNVFHRPRSVREYGYADGDLVVEPGSPSGFLLGWDAIDDQAESVARGRPPMFVVAGEWVRPDGVRFPELRMAPDYLRWAGDRATA